MVEGSSGEGKGTSFRCFLSVSFAIQKEFSYPFVSFLRVQSCVGGETNEDSRELKVWRSARSRERAGRPREGSLE